MKTVAQFESDSTVRGGGKGGWIEYNVILSRLCCFPGLRQQQNGKNNEQKLNK